MRVLHPRLHAELGGHLDDGAVPLLPVGLRVVLEREAGDVPLLRDRGKKRGSRGETLKCRLQTVFDVELIHLAGKWFKMTNEPRFNSDHS